MGERALDFYSDGLRTSIEAIPEDLYRLTETQLRERINPSWKLYQLKEAFWQEFAYAENRKEKIRNIKIYQNKYSRSYFYDVILKSHEIMAWIIAPLVEYEDKARAALHKVTDRYDELISMEITTTKKVKDKDEEKGFRLVTETCPKKALVLLQVLKNLEERVKGSSIQRQLSVNTNTPSPVGGEEPALDMNAVEKRMRELEDKLNPFDKKKEVESDKGSSSKGNEDAVVGETSKDVEVESRRIESVDR